MTRYHLGFDQTLLVRTLNSTRQMYLPTYAGVRLIGSQLPEGENNFLERILDRRLSANEQWRYKKFSMYKGSSMTPEGHQHEYRNCLAPSPLTALAESLILLMLSRIPAFASSERAYSYRWPSSEKSGVSYQYFVEGYKERNADVARALQEPGYVAVVTDIRSFYPSATKEQAQQALHNLFQETAAKDRVNEEKITSFYTQLLDSSGNGIPVGPSSGHVLGHLVLQNVDRELASAYGVRYFRYVDDIIVVCPVSHEDRVKAHIRHCLNANGFSLNEEKTITVDANEWTRNLIEEDVPEADSFRAFARDLTVYLALHPGRADTLRSMFRESGFSIPIDRLRSLSSYPRYRYFLTRRKTRQGLTHALEIWLSKDVDFVKRAARIRDAYEASLMVLVNDSVDQGANHRRWKTQRIRRLVNSLFYLRAFNDWSKRHDAFDAYPELVEQRALAEALATGTVNPILPFYGRGPAAFAELWREQESGQAKILRLDAISEAVLDGLVSLRLTSTVSEEAVLNKTSELRLSGLTAETSPSKRSSPNLDFDDELEALRLGISTKEIGQMLATRYSTAEGTALDALSLLSSEYRS